MPFNYPDTRQNLEFWAIPHLAHHDNSHIESDSYGDEIFLAAIAAMRRRKDMSAVIFFACPNDLFRGGRNSFGWG